MFAEMCPFAIRGIISVNLPVLPLLSAATNNRDLKITLGWEVLSVLKETMGFSTNLFVLWFLLTFPPVPLGSENVMLGFGESAYVFQNWSLYQYKMLALYLAEIAYSTDLKSLRALKHDLQGSLECSGPLKVSSLLGSPRFMKLWVGVMQCLGWDGINYRCCICDISGYLGQMTASLA